MADETEKQEPTRPVAAPPSPPAVRTREEILSDPLIATAATRASDAILAAREAAGEITLTVERNRLQQTAAEFKAEGFRYLVDLYGIDYSTYPGHSGDRFAVSYVLYSHQKNARIRLKVFTPEDTPVPTVEKVWRTANWMEREAFDMYGIVFDGHSNLERILMWDGFNGHPLRKDFPVRGIDTGARIYPEVFPANGGPKPGSTGKDPKDVNLYQGEWNDYGRSPVMSVTEQLAPAPELADAVAESAKPSDEAPWHDPDMPMVERLKLAEGKDLKDKLFAAMAQTDCTACGWDCEGYAAALASGESADPTLCVPGEEETESMLRKLLAAAGKG